MGPRKKWQRWWKFTHVHVVNGGVIQRIAQCVLASAVYLYEWTKFTQLELSVFFVFTCIVSVFTD